MSKWTRDYTGESLVDLEVDIEWEIEHGHLFDNCPTDWGIPQGTLRVTLEWIPEEQP